MLYPTTTDVFAVQLRSTQCADPETVMVAGEFVALLATATLPDTLLGKVGAKITLKVVFCPAVNVTAGASPLVLNPVPVTVAPEIVTFELPVFVKVTGNALLLPTLTLPKLRLVGFAVSNKVAATPVPVSAIVVGVVGALLTSVTLPDTPPAAAGAKAMLKFALCPGLKVEGRVSPLVEKPLPETDA